MTSICARQSGRSMKVELICTNEFAKMKVPFVPGTANFVMVNVGDGHAIFEKLLRQGIIVRPLKGYNLPEWVRISVGTMEENKKLVAAFKEVMRERRSDSLPDSTGRPPACRFATQAAYRAEAAWQACYSSSPPAQGRCLM